MIRLCEYTGDGQEWDAFVCGHEGSTFFHQMGWKNVVENTYGHRPLYLAARENGEIKGILPLFLMNHILFGKFLISVPFGDCSGICANEQPAAEALLNKAKKISQDNGAKFLELRHIQCMNDENLMTKTSRASLILTLTEDPGDLWSSLKPKVRNQVRKAERSGLTSEVGNVELLKDFYNVFAQNMRDLGTPVHSFAFFKNILTEFPQQTNIFLVKYEDKTVGGALAVYFKDIMEVPCASSLRDFFPMCPNNLLYWAALEHGCIKGYKRFSFGRSPWESGTFKFKKQWGAEPVQLYYQYYLNGRGEMPDYTPSTSSRFDMAVWLWKRLPVGLTKVIGPKIIGGIPY